MKEYLSKNKRYDKIKFRRCGQSGLLLPEISLGLWHNFGAENNFKNARKMIRYSFDAGITHFDLANNYGPPYGSAESTFGKILEKDLKPYRDELIISTKAGWDMWPGPYGDFGSRKYLMSSLDQSLKRMNLDYVDIFYHHRPDPETPLEETMGALHDIVKQGKALYVGISQYNSEATRKASDILQGMGTKLLIHQPRYNMFDRWVEDDGLLGTLGKLGMGSIVFSPLEQGLLTNKYLSGIPKDSRVMKDGRYFTEEHITEERIEKVQALNKIAIGRNQSMAQLAISWLLNKKNVTSVLIGASKVSQIKDCLQSIKYSTFDEGELERIENIIQGSDPKE